MRSGRSIATAAFLSLGIPQSLAASTARIEGFADVFVRVCMASPDGPDGTATRVTGLSHVVLESGGGVASAARHVDWMVVGAGGPYEVDVARYSGVGGTLSTCAVLLPEVGSEGLKDALSKSLGAQPTYARKDGTAAVWDLDGRSVTFTSSRSGRPGAEARMVRLSGR